MNKGLKLRIHLEEIEPEIWRQIEVPAELTLRELHIVIQGAVGWEHSHMHMFDIHGRQYQEVSEFDDFGTGEKPLDERAHRIGDLVKKGDAFGYIYDFGDNWVHTVLVEDVVESKKPVPMRCLAGERAGPPEDCGGPYAYPDFLEALADEDHPEHEEMSEWVGEFDPEAFDPKDTTIQIEMFWKFNQGMEELMPKT